MAINNGHTQVSIWGRGDSNASLETECAEYSFQSAFSSQSRLRFAFGTQLETGVIPIDDTSDAPNGAFDRSVQNRSGFRVLGRKIPTDCIMIKTLLERTATAGWRCASCEKLITSVEDGWVEWLVDGEDDKGASTISGFRLVHHDQSAGAAGVRGGCRYHAGQEFARHRSIVEGLPLARFVGFDGLMLLFSFISSGEMPLEDVLELSKRVQIPGYEQSRDLLQNLLAKGLFGASIGEGFYLQSEIQTVLQWALQTVKATKEFRRLKKSEIR